jgi:hypothetical protein
VSDLILTKAKRIMQCLWFCSDVVEDGVTRTIMQSILYYPTLLLYPILYNMRACEQLKPRASRGGIVAM